jgi:hypothetical protein
MAGIAIAMEGKADNSQKKIITHLFLVLCQPQASRARLLEKS